MRRIEREGIIADMRTRARGIDLELFNPSKEKWSGEDQLVLMMK